MEKTTIKEKNLIAKMDNNIGKCRYVEKNLKRWKSGRQFGFLGLGEFVFIINGKTEIIFDYVKTQKKKHNKNWHFNLKKCLFLIFSGKFLIFSRKIKKSI